MLTPSIGAFILAFSAAYANSFNPRLLAAAIPSPANKSVKTLPVLP
jgi:hypothetical protein